MVGNLSDDPRNGYVLKNIALPRGNTTPADYAWPGLLQVEQQIPKKVFLTCLLSYCEMISAFHKS